jgi:hypothetical protein
MPRPLNLLFLTSRSACRAVMAAAWARALAGEALRCESATLDECQPVEQTRSVLDEVGVTGVGLDCRRLDEQMASRADLVVFLGEAGETRGLALPNGAGRIDWLLPSLVGTNVGAGLRHSREMIRLKVSGLLRDLGITARTEQPGSVVLARLGLGLPVDQAATADLTAVAI